ncbi:MAG: metallophosphoesterase [Candidatus Helarchaeota archaeon]
MSKIWTKEIIEVLTTMLRNGESRKNIAKKLNVTRDALDGAIRRYDLQGHYVQKNYVKKYLDNTDFKILDEENFKELKKNAKLKWKISSSKRKKKNKDFEVALFIPDVHIPHENKPACKAVLKLMKDVTFDKFLIMGDFLDYGAISHWNKNKHRTLEMKRLKDDYISGNVLLDEFDKYLPQKCDKYFLKGNHEVWIDDLLEEIPALEGMVEPETQLFLKDRNYKIYEYNQLAKIGRLYATHGIYAGVNPIKKHLDELKVNIIFVHTHTLGMRLSSSPAREIAFSGYNAGCLCDLGPDYMKNRPNSWTHGFAIGYFYPNGFFDIQLIRIVNGKFILNNKIYDGNI